MRFELEESFEKGAKMKVLGVGGAGGNAVNGMINVPFSNSCFISLVKIVIFVVVQYTGICSRKRSFTMCFILQFI